MALLKIHKSVQAEKFTATAALLDGPKERFAYFAAPGKVRTRPGLRGVECVRGIHGG